MQIWTLEGGQGHPRGRISSFAPHVDAFALSEPEQDLANVRLLIAKAIKND